MANPLRKTMVYLGLADEDYDDVVPSAPVAPVSRGERAESAGRAPVTPLRRPAASRHAPAAGMNEILTVHPRQYRDAQMIAETLPRGRAGHHEPLADERARREAPHRLRERPSQGLYGKIERVTNKVFLLSPEHVAVSGEQGEVESEVEAGFFGQ